MIDIISIIALIIVPILAVVIGQWLQTKAEKRKDKMQIFRTLMTSRIYGWTRDSVEALNVLDIVFADDKEVRMAWKDLLDKYTVTNPDKTHLEKILKAQYKLLEEIAKSLGYKDKITWETIQNPYIPRWLSEQIENQNLYNQNMLAATEKFNSMLNSSNKTQEIKEKERRNKK